MPVTELTKTAQIYLDGGSARTTYTLHATDSAAKHAASDKESLRREFVKALSAPLKAGQKWREGTTSVYKYKINGGKGYLAYELNHAGAGTAKIFHYHWNYYLDRELKST